MPAKMKSWRNRLVLLLVAFLVSMLVLFSIMFSHYFRQTTHSYETENQQVVELWNSEVNTRLSSVGYQQHQLMLEIYMDMQAAPGRLPIDWAMQQEYKDMMDEAMQANKDATCFYIIDTESTLTLFASNKLIPFTDVQPLKQYIYFNELTVTDLVNSQWTLVQVGKKQYFVRNIELGRYIIGAMSEASNFQIDSIMEAYGREYSLLVTQGQNMMLIDGNDWKDSLVITEEGDIKLLSRSYAMFSKKLTATRGESVMLVPKMPLSSFISDSGAALAVFSLLVIGIFLLVLRTVNSMIYKPTAAMMTALDEFGQGKLDYTITDPAGSSEFAALFNAFNNMSEQIQTLKIEAYDRQIEEQKQELTRLRQQLVPHFYLNAITTVSNMTYQNSGEEIRSYLATLAKYMRYMMTLTDKKVPLGSELEHVQNYLDLQQARFPGSVYCYIGCPESLKGFEIPYLLVFTLVENTIKHAMDLYSMLQVLVQCEWVKNETFEGCRITVEDNGPGFDKETLEKYTSRLEELPKAKEHIGLTNVIRTMQLTYHRADLVKFSNAPDHGAHVELYIPMELSEEAGTETEEHDQRKEENHDHTDL